ncbi:MAG: hypothetical protein HYY65_06905 [Candidatus Tectomicrobia bacterium]|uniref:Uncharacterized protein n=1 Tax=Tectimicrobiota bacterium TaxID=2528274 RepID=A0A932GPH6_UNCTE|nr:hypothetical protein [Candidatus Tectomicrobia bacterium]
MLAHEMDYEMTQTSPSVVAASTTGFGSSMMAYSAGLLAHFIRGLGYKAVPCGNDTALSIPLAVDAGLGELGPFRWPTTSPSIWACKPSVRHARSAR